MLCVVVMVKSLKLALIDTFLAMQALDYGHGFMSGFYSDVATLRISARNTPRKNAMNHQTQPIQATICNQQRMRQKFNIKQHVGGRPPRYASAPCKLTISLYLFARWRCCCGITISWYLFTRWHLFQHVGYLRHQQQVDLLTLKMVSESRVMWASSVPILVFLGLTVLELRPMYVTDRRQTKATLNVTMHPMGRRHNNDRSLQLQMARNNYSTKHHIHTYHPNAT